MGAYAATQRSPRVLDDQEQAALLKTTGLRKDGFRDHVLFATTLGTGLRESELIALNVGQVFTTRGKARRRVQLEVFKASNPDRSMQEVLLPEALRAKLEKFWAWKRSRDESLADDAPIFISRKGNRLSARQLREAFAKWQERAGFDRRHNFHALRHTACTNLYRRTRDMRLTQRFARHRSITSTAIYTHPTDDDMARACADLPC